MYFIYMSSHQKKHASLTAFLIIRLMFTNVFKLITFISYSKTMVPLIHMLSYWNWQKDWAAEVVWKLTLQSFVDAAAVCKFSVMFSQVNHREYNDDFALEMKQPHTLSRGSLEWMRLHACITLISYRHQSHLHAFFLCMDNYNLTPKITMLIIIIIIGTMVIIFY